MFRFIVVNDLHHADPACTPWMQRLVAHMRAHAPLDFALVLGDLSDTGRPESLAAMRDILGGLGSPVFTVPGNHDCDVEGDTRLYAGIFPGQLNYHFRHHGWQFIGFDSTDGTRWEDTRMRPETLAFLADTAATLDHGAPTIAFTHFPLGEGVRMRSLDADAALDRLAQLDLRCVFSGHYHARTERIHNGTPLITNACCSRVQDNHDASPEKGYLLCTAHPDGSLEREFIPFSTAADQPDR
ncbi:MAG: hypothetical protein D6781_14430 [Verrucomicrobia bacterium]|nr:MAG: hypothetical protein D6781_14430 [Verrucomicrobiota bacterium]